MGGGGQSGTQGITVDSGGMAYPTSTGSDYSWLSALGKGLQVAGGDVARSQDRTNYMTGSPNYPQQQNTGLNVGNRPQSIALDQRIFENKSQQALAQALQRLLAQRQNVIVPDTGAAKYWYVDPRAQAQQQQSPDGQLLPYGTPPSF